MNAQNACPLYWGFDKKTNYMLTALQLYCYKIHVLDAEGFWFMASIKLIDSASEWLDSSQAVTMNGYLCMISLFMFFMAV